MFGLNDKMSACAQLKKITDKNWEPLKCINFPIEEDFVLNKDCNNVKICFSELNSSNEKISYYNIYIGKIITFSEIMSSKKKINYNAVISKAPFYVEDKFFCYEGEGEIILFAKLKEEDIVVSSIEECIHLLFEISKKFKQIERGLSGIKKIYKKTANEVKNKGKQ